MLKQSTSSRFDALLVKTFTPTAEFSCTSTRFAHFSMGISVWQLYGYGGNNFVVLSLNL